MTHALHFDPFHFSFKRFKAAVRCVLGACLRCFDLFAEPVILLQQAIPESEVCLFLLRLDITNYTLDKLDLARLLEGHLACVRQIL